MEKYRFSEELVKKLQQDVLSAMEHETGPHFAAFDADGTLWDSDLGEQFFQYQIDHCQLPALQEVDPWDYYESTKAVDPVKAYLWLAQISAGFPLELVRAWSKQALEAKGVNIFVSQQEFIAWLQQQGVEVFIVTASIQWAVEPAAHLVGVPTSHVVGIQTKIDPQGRVTEKQHGPITWRQGKADALLERTKGVRPVFCAGNTLGDIALIETSVGGKLCSQTQTVKNGLYEEELKLFEHAQKKNWPVHHFFK
jgi:phosphoserine phosphatase